MEENNNTNVVDQTNQANPNTIQTQVNQVSQVEQTVQTMNENLTNSQENKNTNHKKILMICIAIALALVIIVFVIVVLTSKSNKNNDVNDDNVNPEEVKLGYTFSSSSVGFEAVEVNSIQLGVNVSGKEIRYNPQFFTDEFGTFVVNDDGTVSVVSPLNLPDYIATSDGEINKYKMNLSNVKSVFAGILSQNTKSSVILFLHEDGTVSSLFISGGTDIHAVSFTKNASIIDDIDYFADFTTSTGGGVCAVTKDGKTYGLKVVS